MLVPVSRSQTREGLSDWVRHELGVREGASKGNLVIFSPKKSWRVGGLLAGETAGVQGPEVGRGWEVSENLSLASVTRA